MVQTGSLLNVLDIYWETRKARRSDLFLFRFIRGKKLLFGEYLSLLRLAIFVEP